MNLHNVLSVQSGGKAVYLETGVEVKKPPSNPGERGTPRQLLFLLEKTIDDAYKLTHRIAAHEIEALVKRKVRR